MSEYIVIKNIHADDVNFEQNFCVAGNFPAITSIMGLVHSVFRDIKNVKEISVCPIIHHSNKYWGYEALVPTIDNIRDKKGASLIETTKGSIDLSLIIEIESQEEYILKNICNDIYQILKKKTLSGGVLLIHPDNIFYADNEEKLLQILPKLLAGRLISDTTNLLYTEDALEDKLNELIDIIEPKKDEEGNYIPNKHLGYLLPIAIGYAGLEKTKERFGRNGLENHVFVEPVTGLGEILIFSKKKIKNILDKKVFWVYSYNEDNQTFLCVGKKI